MGIKPLVSHASLIAGKDSNPRQQYTRERRSLPDSVPVYGIKGFSAGPNQTYSLMASPLQTQNGPIPASEQGPSSNGGNAPVEIHILEEGQFHATENDPCHNKQTESSPFETLSEELGTGARASVVKVRVKSRGLRFRVGSASSQTTCLYDDADGVCCASIRDAARFTLTQYTDATLRHENVQRA